MTTLSQKGIVGYAVFILAVLILIAQLTGLSLSPEPATQAGETSQDIRGDTTAD
jgi:hypothetical protein